MATAGKEVDNILGDCHIFGPELVTSIVKFREETRGNRDATERVIRLQKLSKEEGVGIETATISIDQLLPQMPEFSGTTSLTILDALDTWNNRLKSARINKTMWGGAVIRKLKNPALDNLLPSVVRD